MRSSMRCLRWLFRELGWTAADALRTLGWGVDGPTIQTGGAWDRKEAGHLERSIQRCASSGGCLFCESAPAMSAYSATVLKQDRTGGSWWV